MKMNWTKGIMQKFGGLENENAILKEKLEEIKSHLVEKETERNSKKHNHSSYSDEDHPRKKKSSGSSS
jgi:hypothetical protein